MLHLAYQDESEYRDGKAQVFCVTALVFEAGVVREVVQAMHSDFRDLRAVEGYNFELLLHGSNMLPNEPDERKLRAFKDVVKNVVCFGGKLIRIGYYMEEFKRPPGDRLGFPFGLIHMSMMNALTMNFSGEIVEVYEMNRSEYERYLKTHFSGMTRHTKEAADVLGGEKVSIVDPHRIIESLFCPKTASWPLMMSDVAGHLLKIKHQRDTGVSVGSFNCTLLPIADSLAAHMVVDEVVRMQVRDGSSA